MRIGILLIVGTAACTFQTSGGGNTDVFGDTDASPPGIPDAQVVLPADGGAPPTPDARTDAAPADAALPDAYVPDAYVPDAYVPDAYVPPDADTACAIEVSGYTDAGRVGGNGGSADDRLGCDGTDVIIGIAMDMSNNATTAGARSAHGLSILCASLTLTSTGPVLGTPYEHTSSGAGGSGWTPSTMTDYRTCPNGSVLSGLQAYTGTFKNLFRNVTMQCSPLTIEGETTGTTLDRFVDGSLDATGYRSAKICGSTQVVHAIDPRTGAGFDSARLQCGTPSCGD